MMNSYRQNNPHQKRQRLLAATVLVFVIFAVDILSGGKIRIGLRVVTGTIWQRGVGVVSAIGDTGFFATRRSLENQIKFLNDEVVRLTESSAEARVLGAENEALRALVDLVEGREGITAPIMSSFRSSPYGTFLVGAGSKDALEVGDRVVSPGGFVVGTISFVGPNSSLVAATLAPNSQIDVQIGESATTVEGRGAGNGYARLPHGIEVEEGDPVVAPIFGGRPIGIVGKVITDASAGHSDVYVGLPVSIETLRYVYIEK
jgi:cell shape-determining protein MreC